MPQNIKNIFCNTRKHFSINHLLDNCHKGLYLSYTPKKGQGFAFDLCQSMKGWYGALKLRL
jgi:hypothetical protein